jgi:hypothetical protein
MEHKPCYGKMMPDLAELAPNQQCGGKAFQVAKKTFGLAEGECKVSSIDAEWDDCLGCAEFDHCWRLSISKQVLLLALKAG